MFKFHGYSGPCPKPPLEEKERFYVKYCCVLDRAMELPPMQMVLTKDAELLPSLLNKGGS